MSDSSGVAVVPFHLFFYLGTRDLRDVQAFWSRSWRRSSRGLGGVLVSVLVAFWPRSWRRSGRGLGVSVSRTVTDSYYWDAEIRRLTPQTSA